jgi:hypothetical protein
MDQSEVASIRSRMEAEYQAAQWAVHGYAQVGAHAFITARMERLGELAEELELRLGREKTMRILFDVLDS